MKRLLVVFMLALTTLSVAMSNAQAKRLGGGGSFGKPSSNYLRQQAPTRPAQAPANPSPAKPAAAPQAASTATPPKPASAWRGMLGGALLGLGLGALLSHFGVGAAAASVISTVLMIALLAVAAMLLIRFFRRARSSNGLRPAYAAAVATPAIAPDIGSRIEPVGVQTPVSLHTAGSGSARANAPIVTWGIPADFDVAGFIRNGKIHFVRLQASWDRGDVDDIREFTTSEMFAELRLQLQERGSASNNTDVVQIDGKLLGIDTIGGDYVATIRFSGLIKEAPEASAEPFSEIWNLTKPVSGSGGWLLAGIQQA